MRFLSSLLALSLALVLVTPSRCVSQTPELADPFDKKPRINGPRVVGGTPGRPFLFRIPASGAKPLGFTVRNIPEGLTLDTKTGILSGVLKNPGETRAVVYVRNKYGAVHRQLTIVSGPDKLARTPPMGWNSWNVWGTNVDDAKIRAAADMLEQTGLADAGYAYINVDDAWEGRRDKDGTLEPNDRFPDMKSLGDFIHGKGLKFGMYTSPGPFTCGKYLGSWRNEARDAKMFASWGVDYLKYDWCSYDGIARKKTLDELQAPYKTMRTALDATDRDIVYSLCQYGWGNVWEWGDSVGGDLWRTTEDITDTWESMSGIGFRQNDCAPFARPGNWNDPDMLVVGVVGWGDKTHPTKLTPDEQLTHVTLWSLLAAPLIIGCDLTKLDDFTLRMLANPEMIAIDQDELGKAATRRWKDGDLEVWARPLADGTVAVGLFNRGTQPATVTANFAACGMAGKQPVRDVWKRKDLGSFSNEFRATVAPHGCAFVVVGASNTKAQRHEDTKR